MALFALKKFLFAALTLILVSMFAFVLVHASPGSPGSIALGPGAAESAIRAIDDRYGWNDPWAVQYVRWVADALRGDLGTSFTDGRDVGAALAARLPVTTSIAVGGTILSGVLGVTAGVIAAVKGGIVDKIIDALSGIVASLPAFWVGILFVYFFAVQNSIFPATGYVPFEVSPALWAQALVLPLLTIGVGGAAFVARQVRVSMLDALGQEHIKTLRATGTPRWRILYIHALRFASLPIVASVAIQFISLFGGSVLAEQLFALAGLGQAIQIAVANHDSPTVQGVVVIATAVVIAVNLFLELATNFLDPKLRLS